MRINNLRSVSRDSINGWEIKNIVHRHYPVAADHAPGCSRIPWICTIQVHPSWRLQADWICSDLAGGGWVPWVEGGRSLLNMIPYGPGWAGIHSTPASFAWHITLSKTAHLMDWSWTLYTQLPPCWAQGGCGELQGFQIKSFLGNFSIFLLFHCQ